MLLTKREVIAIQNLLAKWANEAGLPQDLIIDYNNPKLSPLALKLKELINNKYKYDKNTLFEYLMTLIFDNPSNKDQEYLRALKDIIVNSELTKETEILDNLLLS